MREELSGLLMVSDFFLAACCTAITGFGGNAGFVEVNFDPEVDFFILSLSFFVDDALDLVAAIIS